MKRGPSRRRSQGVTVLIRLRELDGTEDCVDEGCLRDSEVDIWAGEEGRPGRRVAGPWCWPHLLGRLAGDGS